MKLFWFAILMLCILVGIQLMHFFGYMPEWAHNSRFSDSRTLADYENVYKVSFLCNSTVMDNIRILINGREEGTLLPGKSIELQEGDILEIDARDAYRIYTLKIIGENNGRIPPDWPYEFTVEKYLYRFPKVTNQK